MTTDGRTQTQPLRVRRNPLFKDVSDADLQAQFDLGDSDSRQDQRSEQRRHPHSRREDHRSTERVSQNSGRDA